MASVPSGFSEPVAPISDSNQSAVVWIAGLFGICTVLFFFIVRAYIRTRIIPPFQSDDIIIIVATGFAIIYGALISGAASEGLGVSNDILDKSALERIQKILYASDIFFTLALWLSKCSVALLIIRLTPVKQFVRILYALLGTSLLWAAIAVMILALRCNLSQPWIYYNTQCTNFFLRWQIMTAVDIIIECCLFGAVIGLVAKLQMTWQRKLIIVAIFGSRLPVIALAACRLPFLHDQIKSDNPNLDSVPAVALAQIELSYSLVCATVPCLNSFLKAANTNLGAVGPRSVLNGGAMTTFVDKTRSSKPGSQPGSNLEAESSQQEAYELKYRPSFDGDGARQSSAGKGSESPILSR